MNTQQVALGYREGDDLDFYLKEANDVIYNVVIDNIKEDLGEDVTAEECVAELRRLCEKSVRHYRDCECAICR